jgi:hypothetical protein
MKSLFLITALFEPGAGLALLALGVTYWRTRRGEVNPAVPGLTAAMRLNNVPAVVIFAFAGSRARPGASTCGRRSRSWLT